MRSSAHRETDAKPGPLELGRADALNARTQQYLEVVGILDDLLPKGLKCNSKILIEGSARVRSQRRYLIGHSKLNVRRWRLQVPPEPLVDES